MFLAARSGEVFAIKFLVETLGCDVNKGFQLHSPLMIASSVGRVEAVKYLLSIGADVNICLDGSKAIHCAAMSGYVEVMKALIEAGADVEAEGGLGKRPIHIVSHQGIWTSVDWMVNVYGVDVTAQDEMVMMLCGIVRIRFVERTQRALRIAWKVFVVLLSESSPPPLTLKDVKISSCWTLLKRNKTNKNVCSLRV